MATKVKKLWWPLRSMERFLAVNGFSWAVFGAAVAAILQFNYSGFVRITEVLFGFLGGGFGGLLWSLVMWELFFKHRVQRILAAERDGPRPEA